MMPADELMNWAVMIAFGALRYDNFLGAYNISSFLNYNSMFIAIALGMCFVIMTGGIDLSVGSVVAFTSVVVAYLSPYGIRTALDLYKPIYQRTASYGHFGRDPEPDGGFSWEALNLVESFKAAI